LSSVKFVEHDRLGRGTDLVTVKDVPDTRLVFKYGLDARTADYRWTEMGILKAVSGHPNIIPLDRIVLRTDAAGDLRIIGFTTKLVPTKNLRQDTQRPIKFNSNG
jgi:hypothetical protein